jgi:hypothetical protein
MEHPNGGYIEYWSAKTLDRLLYGSIEVGVLLGIYFVLSWLLQAQQGDYMNASLGPLSVVVAVSTRGN